jgi:predicted amidohydrolase
MKHLLALFLMVAQVVTFVEAADSASPRPSRAFAAPRKVVVASALIDLTGQPSERVARACALLELAANEAQRLYGDQGLDLIVFPEFSLRREQETAAATQAVSLEAPELRLLRDKVKALHAWVVMPMVLKEAGPVERYSNAAVLFDRKGEVAGIYRKVHPMPDGRGGLEGGVSPGTEFPVFDCDFGKLGILICWDMAYEEAWDRLAVSGAELVVLPSASPQNARPAAQALRHHYYVLNSAPRDNATLFSPLGLVLAQTTEPGSVVVRQIDLSFAILHWSETLDGGRLLGRRYGQRVGYLYSEREDTGLFWSNDPALSIGAMIRECGLVEMDEQIEAVEAARRKALGR